MFESSERRKGNPALGAIAGDDDGVPRQIGKGLPYGLMLPGVRLGTRDVGEMGNHVQRFGCVPVRTVQES